MNRVISFSGGKDSTALLLKCLEKGKKVHSVVFFDTGWEFPQMYEHINKVEEYTGVEIRKFHPKKPFLYYMLEKEVYNKKGELTKIGRGWPNMNRRWCTALKQVRIDQYLHLVPDVVSYIGFSYDEEKRKKKFLSNNKNGIKTKFPLIDIKMTEKGALDYCRKHGFDWGGLYDHFHRVSCFCCPLQSLWNLRKLKIHYPDLWKKMLLWESKIKGVKLYQNKETVHSLNERFNKEFLLYDT